jgi:hypothetical protein
MSEPDTPLAIHSQLHGWETDGGMDRDWDMVLGPVLALLLLVHTIFV